MPKTRGDIHRDEERERGGGRERVREIVCLVVERCVMDSIPAGVALEVWQWTMGVSESTHKTI